MKKLLPFIVMLIIVVLVFGYGLYKTVQYANGDTEAQIEARKQMEEASERALQATRENSQWYQDELDKFKRPAIRVVNDIERDILGLWIGYTSKNEALRILADKGFEMQNINTTNMMREYYMCQQSVGAEGNTWDSFTITFYKGKVSEVDFVKRCESSAYHEIKYMLEEKYWRWIDKKNNRPGYFTNEVTYIEVSKKSDGVHLVFGDKKLKKLFEEENK